VAWQGLHVVREPIGNSESGTGFFDFGKVAVADDAGIGPAFEQPSDVLAQRFPLRWREFVGSDQADADASAVEPLRVRADFIDMAAGCDCAIVIDDEVVADGVERRVKALAEFLRALEAALLMPLVYFLHAEPFTVGRGGAVNDNAGDLSCIGVHAAMMAAEGLRIKALLLPPQGMGRERIG